METTSIKHVIDRTAKNGKQFRIVIKLADECKNGHNDFSITGDIWEPGKPKIDHYNLCGGAIGDTIAKYFPEFEIFNRLHLCDRKGAPMYPDAKGFYHLNTENMDEAKFCEYYRVTAEQYKELKKAEDQEHFKYLLYSLGIVEQWQKEADEATAKLEELAGGVKFVDNSTRYQLSELTDEERATMEGRIKSGYYSKEKKKERADKKRQEIKDKMAAEFLAEYNTKSDNAKKEYEAKLIVLNSELPLNNFIFYSHNLTGSFNWKGYEKKVTQEEFNSFLEYAKDKTPEGVKWELK